MVTMSWTCTWPHAKSAIAWRGHYKEFLHPLLKEVSVSQVLQIGNHHGNHSIWLLDDNEPNNNNSIAGLYNKNVGTW